MIGVCLARWLVHGGGGIVPRLHDIVKDLDANYPIIYHMRQRAMKTTTPPYNALASAVFLPPIHINYTTTPRALPKVSVLAISDN